MADHRLERLRGLTALLYARDRQALAELAGRSKGLDAARRHWAGEAARGIDADTPVTATAAWASHAHRSATRVAAQQSALQIEINAARDTLARSYGRREALASVIARMERRK